MTQEERKGLAERYARVKAGLPPHVLLVAVSKTRRPEEIQALYELGHRDFGENYPQELRAKQPMLPPGIRWHFIGHLQRSNARHIAPIARLIHGVDSPALLSELQKRAAAIGRTIDVLIQGRIAQEETKHGLPLPEARALALRMLGGEWPNVRLRGLMGMATNTPDQQQVRAEFEALAALFQEIKGQAGGDFDTLSMGMTSDLQAAIAAGSTLVRVGTAIFGERA